MSEHILYVEDDSFVARLAKRRLESDGYKVTVCEDGDSGLAAAINGEHALILLDHMLPGRSGLEILHELVKAGGAPPVVMVSGSSELAVAVEAMRNGAADYVIKETDGSFLDLLPRTIERVLDHVKLLEAKRQADERIAEQAAIIQGVIDNMDPGVTLFDADLNLVAFNDRLSDLFDLPRALLREGAALKKMLGHLAADGEFGDQDAEFSLRETTALFTGRESFRIDHARPNGETIEIRGGPMPGGGYVATYTDITERKRMEEELRRLATTDPLTGANNRRRFGEISSRELARCKRYNHSLCVLMLDADHFKAVNDAHGHDAGDMVLKSLAEVCFRELRDVDVFGRFGGEEFTVTLPQTPLKTALEAAERLRKALEEAPVEIGEGSKIHFTVSIGAAAMIETDEKVEDLLARADAALYRAKEEGRNRVVAAE